MLLSEQFAFDQVCQLAFFTERKIDFGAVLRADVVQADVLSLSVLSEMRVLEQLVHRQKPHTPPTIAFAGSNDPQQHAVCCRSTSALLLDGTRPSTTFGV